MQDNATGTSFEGLLVQAASGQMPIFELIDLAQRYADIDSKAQAIALYQAWLERSSSPLVHAVHFNLAVNLVDTQREDEAEKAYRAAIAANPGFTQAYLNLSRLLTRRGRGEEALQLLRSSGQPSLIDEANRRAGLSAEPSIAPQAVPQPAAPKPAAPPRTPAPVNKDLPLVSILIPTHNRPDFFEIAFKSALEQSYGNIQVVVSDNSDDERTRERITPYLSDTRIVYHREPGLTALNNFAKCLELATGEYVNFLMDDDIFHPDKIRRMMDYFLSRPGIGLVTSFRQLIDENGNFLPPANPTQQLFEKDTLLHGETFGEYILKSGRNVLGEPTTVLARREDIGTHFGRYFGQQFVVLADVATWLEVLAKKKDCVYIADALSYFRIHPGQDQKNSHIKVHATIDWFRLFMTSHKHNVFIRDRAAYHEMLAGKLSALTQYITTHHADLRTDVYKQQEIHQLVSDAVLELLTP